MNIALRKTDKSDLPRLSEWIAKDSCPQHRGVEPTWWMTTEEEEKKSLASRCFVVEDFITTKPLFYLKIEHVMRCFIQFPPDDERDPEVTKAALEKAFKMISSGGRTLGYTEMIFDSKSRGLINLFTSFGFTEAKDNFLVRL